MTGVRERCGTVISNTLDMTLFFEQMGTLKAFWVMTIKFSKLVKLD